MLGDLNIVLFSVISAITMVFLIALGSAILQGEFAGRSLGWLSIVAAALNAITVVTSMTFSAYHGAAWSIPAWGAFIGALLVVAVVCVSLLRTKATAPDLPAVLAAA